MKSIKNYHTKYFDEKEVLVCRATYAGNGAPALVIYSDGHIILTPSINLDLLPREGCIFIKDYANCEGILCVLLEAGVISNPRQVASNVMVTIYECDLLI